MFNKTDHFHANIFLLNTNAVDTQNDNELELQSAQRVPSVFEHGFFEVSVRMENRVIKANCLTCQRMGRANLIQAREYSSSNLLAHLKVSDNFGGVEVRADEVLPWMSQ